MAFVKLSSLRRIALIGAAAFVLAACQESMIPKEIRPVSDRLVGEMKQSGMKETSPIFVRIFKEESEMEIWKERPDGRYALLKTYDICKWSGVLGPKLKEGDRQAPEGFYVVKPAQMNPKSKYYLSFNIGYPNTFDRAHERTGSHLMVHGGCSSAGCYSMTDEDAGEIFALARDAFKGGQRAFQIQAFPFRMTPENFAKHRGDANMEFWKNLKVGYDHFEVTRKVPKVDVCGKRYVFNADAGNASFSPTGACPTYSVPEWIATAVAEKQAQDEAAIVAVAAKMDADAARLAEQKQKLAEEQAAEAAEEAERAAQPTVMERIFSRRSARRNAEPAPAAPAETPEPADTAAAAPAAAPAPRAKPAPAETDPVETAAVTETGEPEVGRKVERTFLWPEDAPTLTGGSEVVPSTLTAPAAN
ncbi:L,D-transpeptidase family protein [Bauldia sp.]|uniref:L,D-transpeptidase family protein n=1 Tax=Bauldia sp. TaxID=2575872 RepID=UPI003BA8F23A